MANCIELNPENNLRHFPTLKTVLIVEETLRKAGVPIKLEELKRKLPMKIQDQSLRLILSYLEEKGDIDIGSKGILWIRNDSPKLIKLIENGIYA